MKINNDGFFLVKNLFKSEEIEQIRSKAKQIFELQIGKHFDTEAEFERNLYAFFKQDQAAFENCGKHIQHLIPLHQLSLDSRIIDNLGFEFPNICTRPVLYFNSKHLATKEIYYKTPAHQDWFSMEGSLDSMVVWMPLVNVDKKLGALQVVPGSHQNGLLTSKVEDSFGLVDKYEDKDFVSVEMGVGDALFFSAFLVHRSGDNITDSIRWSCHFRYNNLADKDFIHRKFPHPYIYKPICKK